LRDTDINPIIKSDYPDPDVIRVDDTYYMASTTMHFLPGGAILRSYDLIHWELINYIFTELDDNPYEKLEMESTNYGCGMWAPTLRYHKGKFYAAFVSHKTEVTYLFTTEDITGKWEKSVIKGYYHDLSLLFDDDDRVYVVYGNRDIHLLELDSELKGPKEGGIDKIILSDVRDIGLGHEGSHFYKINGKYYLFTIHWMPTGSGRRTETCYVSDTVDGEYKGGDVLDDDMGFFNMGVAQGGIVDTPAGKWYGILFRDNGAVGRIPVIVPVTWENDYPVFGRNGKALKNVDIASSRPYYRYEPVYTSDDFKYPWVGEDPEHPKLKLQWQWNHRPDIERWKILEEGGLAITSGKICANITHAKNILTQRCMYPKCEAEVLVDGTELKDGDIAGICILQGFYSFVGITKDTGAYYIVKYIRPANSSKGNMNESDYYPGQLVEKIKADGPVQRFCVKTLFEDLQDRVDFYYVKEHKYVKVGMTNGMKFMLDHFVGARFGLFVFSTKKTGGTAVFKDFEYRYI